MNNNCSKLHDVIIIGSGAAGLSCALQLSDLGSIAVLSKGPLPEGSTFYAQGGIAAVLDSNDSVKSHVDDTLMAGAGLCNKEVVEYTVSHSREAINWLIDNGVQFSRDTDDKQYHLTKEGGHSHRRIIHSADTTGQEVQTTLVEAVKAQPSIKLFEQYNAIDLITTKKLDSSKSSYCYGIYALNKGTGEVEVFQSRFIILATGGASKVYLYTSNPDVASGDGIALAWRAGCSVSNLEFNQFHPTCLYHSQANNFLITEAIRGEGGILVRPDGTRFMDEVHPMAELAPRDIVARTIDLEMKRLGVDCMYLDISHKSADFITGHFPNIYKRCLALGIDITKEPIPIVPAAHYTCGGVRVDITGRTDVDGLYAVGEVACTGLHGANRMASNSLLECLVFAKAAADDIRSKWQREVKIPNIKAWDSSRVTDSDEEVVVHHNWHELRRLMWNYVGIVRSNKRLERAERRIKLLQQEIREYYVNFRVTSNLLELRNLVMVAELMVACARKRHESRGLHFTLDYPEIDPAMDGIPTVIQPRVIKPTDLES
ncbi:MAG: L-aspartate oxidase [Gammaproteobacteria bacterium]|nr:MAG: L-aspartate oxidase [Gammaproteobacteria bacterium]